MEITAQGAAIHCLTNDPESEVVLDYESEIGKLFLHWCQTAQLEKT
eukprot:IDg5475t1